MAYGYGYDIKEGNTTKLLLDLAKHYGPVTSFTGVPTSYCSSIWLEVGGNPFQQGGHSDMFDFEVFCHSHLIKNN
jgi:hypothetical protein